MTDQRAWSLWGHSTDRVRALGAGDDLDQGVRAAWRAFLSQCVRPDGAPDSAHLRVSLEDAERGLAWALGGRWQDTTAARRLARRALRDEAVMRELVATSRALALPSSSFVDAALVVSALAASSEELAARLAALRSAPPCASRDELSRAAFAPCWLDPSTLLLRLRDPFARTFEAWSLAPERAFVHASFVPAEDLGAPGVARARLGTIAAATPRGSALADVHRADIAERPGVAFVVHEAIEGEPLAARVVRAAPEARVKVVLDALAQIAPSLDAAHDARLPPVPLVPADIVFQPGRSAQGGRYGQLLVDPERVRVRDRTLARVQSRLPSAALGPAAVLSELALDAVTSASTADREGAPPGWREAAHDARGTAVEMVARLARASGG